MGENKEMIEFRGHCTGYQLGICLRLTEVSVCALSYLIRGTFESSKSRAFQKITVSAEVALCTESSGGDSGRGY